MGTTGLAPRASTACSSPSGALFPGHSSTAVMEGCRAPGDKRPDCRAVTLTPLPAGTDRDPGPTAQSARNGLHLKQWGPAQGRSEHLSTGAPFETYQSFLLAFKRGKTSTCTDIKSLPRGGRGLQPAGSTQLFCPPPAGGCWRALRTCGGHSTPLAKELQRLPGCSDHQQSHPS